MADSVSKIYGWARANPLAFVLLVAILVRIPAVIWSKGFIHSDDHYDSVMIAYDWLIRGFWGEDGFLRWRSEPSHMIGRFPLYTLSLWAVMKTLKSVGIHSLDSMMYVIRGLHALCALLPIWAACRITTWVTRSHQWTILVGLSLALNFALPFLGVRNLIEIVGGNLWLVAILAIYKWQRDARWIWPVVAGMMAALAWMIRFQMAFAVMPIPIVLWYEAKSVKPALQFGLGVATMLVLSGLMDLALLGRFAGSTITNLSMNFGLPPLYKTIPLLYPGLLLLLLVPPLSFIIAWLTFRKSFIREHLALWTSSMSFVLCHSLVANQQERFVFSIVPAFILLGGLALWHQMSTHGRILKNTNRLKAVLAVTMAINMVGLIFLTPAYGHKGLIEPVLKIRDLQPKARVLFVQPDFGKYMPISYGGEEMSRFYVRSWSDLERLRCDSNISTEFDFVVLYPPHMSHLDEYLDSAATVTGPLDQAIYVAPSIYNGLLHVLNRKHNPSYEAWVYRPAD